MSGHAHEWARENAALFAAVRCAPRAEWDVPDLAALDWDYVLRAANLHGVLPLLHTTLPDNTAIPALVTETARSAYWTTHFRNRTLLGELKAVLNAAAERGIAVMLLKGALLAPCYYPTPALRPMSDLDCLVRTADLGAFGAVLRDLGYREIDGQPGLVDERLHDPMFLEYAFTAERDGVPVLIEYRAEPLAPLRLALTELDTTLAAHLRRSVGGIWERGQQGEYDGAPFARMAVEDVLLHIASHSMTRHSSFRLLWLHDLCRVVAQHPDAINWEQLAREARTLRLGAPVLAALEAAHRWLDAPIPMERIAMAFVPRAYWLRAPMQTAESRLFAPQLRALDCANLTALAPALRSAVALSLMRLRGPRATARALRWMLAPSRAYMRTWSQDITHHDLAYGRALALRAVISVLRLVALIQRRSEIRLPDRVAGGIAARFPRLHHLMETPLVREESETPTRWI